MRPTRFPAAALAAILLLSPAARGLEDPAPAPPGVEYEQKLADHRRALAKPALRLAGWCFARDLKLSARRLDETIVRLDPDLQDPRLRLGHRREGKGWQSTGKPLPAVVDRWNPDRWKQYVKARDEVLAESAALSREFARWCESAGRGQEAKGSWYDVLRYLPADPEARKALGYEELDVSWTLKPLRSRAAREAWLDTEVRQAAVGESLAAKALPSVVATRWQTAPDSSLNQAASSRFVIDTTFPADDAREFLRLCHASREAVKRLGIVSEAALGEATPWAFVILSTKADYDRIVIWSTEKDTRKRAYYLSLSGFYPGQREYLNYSTDAVNIRGTLVHKVAEHLASASWTTGASPWYFEGAACLAVEALSESGNSRCVSGSSSSVRTDPLDDSRSWGSLLVEGLSAGKERELSVLLRLDLNDMDGTALLQSWSLLWWMREVGPARLQAFTEQLQATKNSETACLNAFGCPEAAVERAWKDWIRSQWIGTAPGK